MEIKLLPERATTPKKNPCIFVMYHPLPESIFVPFTEEEKKRIDDYFKVTDRQFLEILIRLLDDSRTA